LLKSDDISELVTVQFDVVL